MKRSRLYVSVLLLVPVLSFSQTGATCTSPIPIPMDGVLRNYTISASTGSNLVCTSSGTTPITYFSIVANSSAEDMLLKITGPNNQPVEVAFYDGIACTNGNLESASSICFYDGKGIWAPSESFVITANKTYIIRIKTATTGTIQISGQHYTPPNNSCLTATTIGTQLLFDNNAAHKPTTDVSTSGICAADIDNTAIYVYTVGVTGTSSVSIENMDFDNNYQSNMLNLGFQVGLFKGTCAGLTSIACYVGVATNAQISAGVLPAGTKVYVAIDGILGSNCDYGIRAINSVILAAELKYFTAWKQPEGNILKWTSLKEYDNTFFEIERSVDGLNYETIDRIAGQLRSNSEKDYQYIDLSPPSKSFYRLKMITTGGKASYSNIIKVDRTNANFKVRVGNIVNDQLSLRVNDVKEQRMSIKIIDPSGREVYQQNSKIKPGENLININANNLSNGFYYLILTGTDYREAFPFIKS